MTYNLPLIKDICGEKSVQTDVDMKPYTSMRVGGRAAMVVDVPHEDALQKLLRLLTREKVPFAILGNGSNLIVADEGFDGVLMHIGSGFSTVNIQDTLLSAGAGILLSALSKVAYENGLSGLEFASGIPGSLGGALAMNAGAYGREMKDVVLTTRCIDGNGNAIVLQGDEHDFSYRHSRITASGYVAVSARLQLIKGDKQLILETMKDLNGKRLSKQPLNFPSAGSTFKRPVGYFSGKLIEDCGLKGLTVGGAQISEKHAGFIVNTGNATATDVVMLVQKVREMVFERTGVRLEPEVKLLKGDSQIPF